MPVPARFAGMTLDDYRVGKNDHDTKHNARAAVEEFLSHDEIPQRGLSLMGMPGTGKTMLASIICNHLGVEGFLSVVKYQRLLMSVMHQNDLWTKFGDEDALGVWNVQRRMLAWIGNELPLLVVDDLGKEHTSSTKYIEDELNFMLRRRFDAGLTTLVTTNFKLNEISAVYGPPMSSFLHEATRIITVLGADHRVEAH